MAGSSRAKPRHNAKRRKTNSSNTIVVASPLLSQSSIDGQEKHFEPSDAITPIVRPPEAPFYPNAIELWVVRDPSGQKKLVSEIIPGCWHWRIGDPNMSYCFKCSEEGDLIGCRTCKRSYHRDCLEENDLEGYSSRHKFHCPTCVERGWNLRPPPEILPLTPISSREASPSPRLSESTANQLSVVQNQVTRLSENTSVGGLTKQVRNQDNDDQNQIRMRSQHSDLSVEHVPPEVVGRDLAQKFRSSPNVHQTGIHAGDLVRVNKRKSRYQTMSSEVDQALATIYRELESAENLRQEIKMLTEQVKSSDQARQILDRSLALERITAEETILRKDAEMKSMKQQLDSLIAAHETVVNENKLLKQQLQERALTQAKIEEMEALKSRLRQVLGE